MSMFLWLSSGGFWVPSLFGVGIGIGIESFIYRDYEEKKWPVTTCLCEVLCWRGPTPVER